jgi:tetratricopeptide (TPR) repeat protein
VQLKSYDTRLYVVFVFLPIFPLKRMRIIDYCSVCTRHYAMEADKWEAAKQLEVSGAMEKFRAQPTPEAAMAAHQQLLNFHQLEPAAEFRKTMRAQFADNAKVHAYLGAALEHFGQLDEANGCFVRALELRPDLPEARIGVARGQMRAGRLDEARRLLDFLEKPGASQLYPLEPLDTLARAYQNANRHDDALALFASLQNELPKVAEEKWFRLLVAKSEKTSGRRNSQLPKLKFSLKRLLAPGRASTARTWLILGILLAVGILGFVLANEFTRRHRTLYIVNGYALPADVQIADVGEFKRIRSVESVPLAEGRYHATISGPVQQELDFEVRASYWGRWFKDPAWVLNIGGEALLIERAVVYSQNPRPPTISFHFGKPFEQFARVTHPFTDLPESLRMKSTEERTLVELQRHQGTAADIFDYLLEQKQTENALHFGERWLRAHADDEHLLRRYLATTTRQGQTNRANGLLRSGLTARPVHIEWHRAYQDGRENPVQLPALIAEYDAWLAAEPTNSALLYLRGRIEGNRTQVRQYFEQARQADANNPYPLYALGYESMVAGDWDAARPLFAQAAKLHPQDQAFEHWLTTARLALGESAEIEQATQKQLAGNPADFSMAIRLIDALVAQGKRDEAIKACKAFARACSRKYGAAGNSVANLLRGHALYALGDFAELETVAAPETAATARTIRWQAMVEQGHMADALKSLPAPEPDDEDYRSVRALALAVAFREAGNTAEAEHWLKQACQNLAKGNEDNSMAATMLDRATAPTLAEAQALKLRPQLKAVWLAAIILQRPAARADLAPLARKLNVDRAFPYHLIERVTAETR